MRACAEAWQEDHDVEIAWDWRSLEAFGDQPLEELAPAYDLLVIDHPFCGTAAATRCLAPLDDLLLRCDARRARSRLGRAEPRLLLVRRSAVGTRYRRGVPGDGRARGPRRRPVRHLDRARRLGASATGTGRSPARPGTFHLELPHALRQPRSAARRRRRAGRRRGRDGGARAPRGAPRSRAGGDGRVGAPGRARSPHLGRRSQLCRAHLRLRDLRAAPGRGVAVPLRRTSPRRVSARSGRCSAVPGSPSRRDLRNPTKRRPSQPGRAAPTCNVASSRPRAASPAAAPPGSIPTPTSPPTGSTAARSRPSPLPGCDRATPGGRRSSSKRDVCSRHPSHATSRPSRPSHSSTPSIATAFGGPHEDHRRLVPCAARSRFRPWRHQLQPGRHRRRGPHRRGPHRGRRDRPQRVGGACLHRGSGHAHDGSRARPDADRDGSARSGGGLGHGCTSGRR